MRTSIAGTLAASLLALFGFLGAEPVSWPRSAALIAGCIALALLGIFAQSGPPAKPAPLPPQPLPAVLAPPAAPSRPEADKPATVGP